MVTLVWTPVLALFLVVLAFLTPIQAAEIMTPDELRELAYSGQVDEVEKGFATAQAAFVRGDVSADYMRELVMVLTVSHPKMATLTENWLQTYPNSPYAHTVQAWLYNDIAWNIRGPRVISKSYPDAISEFYAWHRKALGHAEFAYEKAPRLIPASDAIIKFANGAGNRLTSFQVLEEVMKTDPNMGTLRRSLWLTAPGWGGSAQQAMRMCETYAPGLEAIVDPVVHCKLYAWADHHPYGMSDWAHETVGDTENPDIAYFRMFGILNVWGSQGPEDAEFSFEYLTRDGVIWRKAAETFDANIPQRYGYPYIYEAHHRKSLAYNREQLELDPYNPDLIDALRITLIPDLHRDGTGQPLKEDDILRLTPQEEKELVRRQLISSPYESRFWSSMSRLLSQDSDPGDLLSADPYQINAVVYSNHSMWPVRQLMLQKREQYKQTLEVRYGEVASDRDDITRDVDNDIICPLIRVYRLHKTICPATKDEHSSSCTYSKYEQADLDAVLADATARNICIKERFSPVSWLYYTPVTVDIEGQSGG